MSRKLIAAVALLTAAALDPAPAHALGYVYPNVRIEQLSGHNNNGDGDLVIKFDRDVCQGSATDARLYKASSANFETMASLLTAAFLAGKTMKIQTNDTDCALQYVWIQAQ